jgi:hypothetical protein
MKIRDFILLFVPSRLLLQALGTDVTGTVMNWIDFEITVYDGQMGDRK